MFNIARLKLTFWYLLIIVLISSLFSLVLYKSLTFEFERFERMQRVRMENQNLPLSSLEFRSPRFLRDFDPEIINQTKERIRNNLILINLSIVFLSGGAAYFLAGRTLKPIEEMLDEQNRFIADASHELRTPLTSLKSEIEVSLRDKKFNLNDAKNLLKSNLEEVNNLNVLTDKLIDLAGYQKIKSNINFDEINLQTVSFEAINQVKKLAQQNNIIIKNKVKNIILKGDFNLLVQLLVIFLDNAIKYSPKDTVISLTAKTVDNMVNLTIKDQGLGIESSDLPFIFDRFYRADKSRSKNISGYGLGLSIAKNIIDLHHGSIKIESEINKGTTFIVDLPIKQKNFKLFLSLI